MRRQHILLFTTLLFLIILQNTNADDQRTSSPILYEDHLPSTLQTPSKSKSTSDQLLLLTPVETPKISRKPRPPAQDSSWFGKLKSKAKDSLNSAKEAIKSHVPESVTEHARSFGDQAKRFSETVTSQAEKVAYKAEKIYDTVSSKLTQEVKKPNEPSQEIKLAADFIDQDGDKDVIPIRDEAPVPSNDENKGIFSAFKQKISDVSNSVKNKVKYASISQSVSNKFKSIKEKTESLLHVPSKIDLKGTFSNLGKHVQAIPQKISQKFSEITQSSDNTAEKPPSWFSQSFEKAKQKLKSIVPSAAPLKEKISSTYHQVKDKGFSSVSNLFTGAKDSISKFAGTAKGRFSENLGKITQKVKQAVPVTIPFKEKITSAYQQVKDRTFPSVSNLFKGAKDTISRFGSSAKGKLAETFEFISPKFLAPVYGIMNLGSWMWNLMAWRKFVYWFVGIVVGCLLLKVLLFLLPFIQMTVSVLKTPFQVLFMINSLIRQFYPNANPENGAQRQRTEPEIKKKVEAPKEKDRSYHRYSSSQEEWRRAGHHELHEPTRPRDLDSDEIRRRFEDIQENEERYYNYYKCYGCSQQWENVTIGKGPVQECRNENCKYAFGPYHQIPLLNNKQKKEEFQKVKTE